jgi:hypothetical protein
VGPGASPTCEPVAGDGEVAAGSLRAELSRSLAFLYASGATLGAISLALPHPPREDELGLGGAIIAAYAVAVAVLVVGRRLPVAAHDCSWRSGRG